MNDIATPRPTWFQRVCATLVMLVATAIISTTLLLFVEGLRDISRDLVPIGLGLIVIAVALAIMAVQYYGMFGFSKLCTTLVFWMLSVSFVFSCVFLFASIQMIERAESFLVAIPIGLLVLLCMITGFGLQANWRWRETLATAKAQGTLPTRQASFTLLELMMGTLMLAIMIGPASYLVGVKMPIYRENLSAQQAPFPVSPSAERITYRRESNGSIQAIWYQTPADLQQWLAEVSKQADVNEFSSTSSPLRNESVAIPQPPSAYGLGHKKKTLSRAHEAIWNYGDRRAILRWDAETQSGLTTVYYGESKRRL